MNKSSRGELIYFFLLQPTDASEIKWVRASILFPEAQLVVEGSSKDDVNQGRLGNITITVSVIVMIIILRLGDCWFLCALAGAATVPHTFKELVPKDQVTVLFATMLDVSSITLDFLSSNMFDVECRASTRSGTLASSTSSSGSMAPGWTSWWTTSYPPSMGGYSSSRVTTSWTNKRS